MSTIRCVNSAHKLCALEAEQSNKSLAFPDTDKQGSILQRIISKQNMMVTKNCYRLSMLKILFSKTINDLIFHMNIRLANFIDTPRIAEIHVETWRIAYKNILPEKYLAGLSVDISRQTWENAINRRTPEIRVAEHNGLIIGWIAFGPSRDDDASSTVGEIEAVYVTAECWSCGFGKGLLDTAKQRLTSQGFDRLTLWALSENRRALDFYTSCGFIANDATTKFITIGDTKLKVVRYEISLIP